MKIKNAVVGVMAIVIILGFTGAVLSSGKITPTEEVGLNIKTKILSNASYPDGNNVNNITLVYNSHNSSFLIFWDEDENYTYQGKEYKTSEIMISESSDFVNWTGAKRDIVISYEDGTNSTNPAGVVDPNYGSINVIWSEMNKTSHHWEIYFGQSYDGINWISTNNNTLVTNNRDGKVSDCIFPDIAVDMNGAYLQGAWLGKDENTGTWEVYYGNYSLQSGGNWSSQNKDTIISREDSINATPPTILVGHHSPITTWIFWSEYNKSSSQYEIYKANRSSTEATWHRNIIYNGTTEVNNVTSVENYPYIYVFWEQMYNGHSEIYSMRYNETGDKWGNATRVSYPDGHDARNPSASASASSGNIFVVWDEYDENTSYQEIMISNSTGGGWSGSSGDIAVTDTKVYHSNPCIYVNSTGEIYLSLIEWHEYKQRGSMEISTLSARSNEVIPEFYYIVPLSGVFVYVIWKRRRTKKY